MKKRKLLFSLFVVLILTISIVSIATGAITFYRTDGFWGRIDDGYDGVRFDVVGVTGTDPGDYWGSGDTTTRNDTLIRNATVCTHNSYGDATLAEWTGISPAVYTNLGSHTYGPGACDYGGFFISEYIEGDGFGATDAIELYNNTNKTLNFSTMPFYIQIFEGGSDIGNAPIPLTGTLAPASTYVIASADIPGITENQISASLSYSGDDAVALIRYYIPDTDGETDGATDNQWSSGPSGNDPNAATSLEVDNVPIVQLNDSTDWNQVRYGEGTQGDGWFYQSGLAFHGTINDDAPYGDEAPFLVGKFCHVNNPIQASNEFLSSPLTLDLYNIGCGEYAVAPFPPPRMTFVYPVYLDETSNSGLIGDCPYPSTQVCSDAVTFASSNAKFTCHYPGDIYNEYTVAILGFMHLANVTDTCEDVDYVQAQADGIFISNEGNTNCGCLYAMITQSEPTAVELISFEAQSISGGVKITWESASETDNLGYNLYRADSLNGERVLLNKSLIPTNVPPGSPFGAVYEYIDETATGYQTYFYWLEDLDADGKNTLHGPASVIRN